ncbi:hypothetical protein [Solidesulfovibrio sp. C21]|uniref:hypothetical protein n=1 Tax=Solidesulfovibrio sp. C21 TaxID=3398613 RepID=UPI0039FB8D63
MPNDVSPNILPPADQPKDVGKAVLGLFLDCMADRESKGLPARWNRNYRLGQGVHWERTARQAGVPLTTANLLHLHRTRTVNTLTNNNPTFNVFRVGPEGDEDVFQTIGRLADYWWAEQEQQPVFEQSVINGETYGVTVEKVVFDPNLEGIGEVETVVIEPWYFGMHPVDTRDIQKANAVLHFQAMDIREARRRWPKFADKIKADAQILEQVNDTRNEVVTGSAASGLLMRFAGAVRAFFSGPASNQANGQQDKVLVIECWAKDYTQGPDGDLYPGKIRCVTVCNAGTLVLADRPNPSINPTMDQAEAAKTWLYDKFPYSLAVSNIDPASPWGSSDFDQLASLQMEINKCLSQITYHKDQAARPKIINPRDSGVPNEAFSNRMGIINPVSAALSQSIRYMEFPNNTADIQAVMGIYKELLLQIAATFDLERGDTPGQSVIAYKALAALIEQASTMEAGKIRHYSKLIRDRGRMFLSHVQNWYTEERWISFSDADGRTTPMSINGKLMRVPARLTVVNGSTMPVSKIQQREEALELYKEQAIDRQDLLEKLEYPNAREVSARMAAGPAGQAIQNLVAAGIIPAEAADQATQIATMDPKDVAKAVEDGEIKPADQGQPQGPSPEEQAASQAQAIEAQKGQAEIKNTQADTRRKLAEAAKLETETALAGSREQRESADVAQKMQHDQEVHRLGMVKAVGEIKRESESHRHKMDMDSAEAGRRAVETEAKARAAAAAETTPAPVSPPEESQPVTPPPSGPEGGINAAL